MHANMQKSVYLILIFLCSTNIYAGIRPSFYLDSCAWRATDIIIATEGDVIDGKFTVIDSIKGNLQSGQTISIPELALFRSKSLRLIQTPFYGNKDDHPKYVSGSRMILFLKRKPQLANAKGSVVNAKSSNVWEPASDEGMNVSVIWIEGEQSFAFIQLINPGDSLLVEYGKSEEQIRERSLEVIQIQDSLNTAIAIPDKSKRAEALSFFASSDLYLAQELAFEELQKCGDAALPILRNMLNDNSKLELHNDVIASMTKVGGKSVGAELTEIIRDELLYWKVNAPRLKDGWWNQIDDPETQVLRGHYMKLYQSLRSLNTLEFADAKAVVTELRDFWRSLPQLEDRSGLDQMSKECDNFLLKISREH